MSHEKMRKCEKKQRIEKNENSPPFSSPSPFNPKTPLNPLTGTSTAPTFTPWLNINKEKFSVDLCGSNYHIVIIVFECQFYSDYVDDDQQKNIIWMNIIEQKVLHWENGNFHLQR